MLGLLASLPVVTCAQPPRKEVIGYYPSWKWRSRDNLVSPARLPYEKFTIINYAFFAPLSDGRIAGKDSIGDTMYLQGDAGTTLVGLAHRHGVRVVLSLGGWEDSDNFPAIAATAPLRATFSHSCMEALRHYGFDGIDVDWEFPGYVDHKGTPEDRDHFTLLLSSLRDSLNAHGRKTGRSYLLTAALPAGAEHVRNIDVERVSAILDQLNLMTYDFYGPWDPLVNHNCPLYSSAETDTTRCVDAAYRLYHEALGVPASKINIGVPFYGKAYAGCVALNSPHSGSDTVHFPASGPFYYDIAPALGRFTRLWDEKSKVPYLVNADTRVLVSYDDEASIRAKAHYVVDHGIHGVIIWEITGDFLPDGTTPLLDALRSGLDATPGAVR